MPPRPSPEAVLANDTNVSAELVSVPPVSATVGSDVRQRGAGPPRPPMRCRYGQLLLRKEVIQPHLPVRLPCYDFVLIADPTFDSSLPEGLGHWLRVLPTFMT